MNWSKRSISYIVIGVVLGVMCISLFAWGTSDSTKSKPNMTSTEKVKIEKVKLASDIENVSQGRDIAFLLKLKNDSGKHGKLTFTYPTEFKYKIKDAENKVVFTSPKEKKLSDSVSKSVKPKSTYDSKIDISKVYAKLKDGNYLIEAVSTAQEANQLQVGISFVKSPATQKKYATEPYIFDKMESKSTFSAHLKGTKVKVIFEVDDSLGVMVKRLRKSEKVLLTYELAPDTNILKAFEKM